MKAENEMKKQLARRQILLVLLLVLILICVIYIWKGTLLETVFRNRINEKVNGKVYVDEQELDQTVVMAQSVTAEKKKVALTFDDGPHPSFTEELLDGLKERGVCATFFVTGENASTHPDIIKRMSEEGHLIGNHTYSHIQLKSDNREQFKQELIQTNEIIRDITGEMPIYVRPPYGTWDKSLEAELNMFPVLWNVDPKDWCNGNADCVAYLVEREVEENDIILLHDYYRSSVQAALEIVDELQKEGYTFVTVDEILFD